MANDDIITRLKRCGSVKGVFDKIRAKWMQRGMLKRFGSRSFPSDKEREAQEGTHFPCEPKFSILTPLYNTPEEFLYEMIMSVMGQTYGNFELCLADGSDSSHAYVGRICKTLAEKDGRIIYKKLEKNEGISGNTNECLKLASGDYIGLLDHDDVLHPCALFEYAKAINEREADFLYCDEVTFNKGDIDHMLVAHFKPDFAIDNLRSNNYICHFTCFKRTLLDGMELFRREYDGSQDHDMVLRLTAKADHIVHVPKILYYWRSHPGSVAEDLSVKSYAVDSAIRAIEDHLRGSGLEFDEVSSVKGVLTHYHIKYKIKGDPKVSLIIPNMNHLEDLKRCIDSVLDKTSYGNFEIIVAENNSDSTDIFNYYDEINRDSRIHVVYYKGEFNYSAVNNFAANEAKGDFLLLLNNDCEVISPDWIQEMLMFAQREDVGAVGAKLYYPDGTIQHAGVILGLGPDRVAGHIFYQMPGDAWGYMGRMTYAQNLSAVTGAALMVSKEHFNEVGGLDETFKVGLNDVDFCLKLRDKGYVNVWTPFARLTHYESRSRGLDTSPEKAARFAKEVAAFKDKWGAVLASGDPYYNPNLSLDYQDCRIKE